MESEGGGRVNTFWVGSNRTVRSPSPDDDDDGGDGGASVHDSAEVKDLRAPPPAPTDRLTACDAATRVSDNDSLLEADARAAAIRSAKCSSVLPDRSMRSRRCCARATWRIGSRLARSSMLTLLASASALESAEPALVATDGSHCRSSEATPRLETLPPLPGSLPDIANPDLNQPKGKRG